MHTTQHNISIGDEVTHLMVVHNVSILSYYVGYGNSKVLWAFLVCLCVYVCMCVFIYVYINLTT